MSDALHVVGIQADLAWENPEKNLIFFETKIKSLPKNPHLVVLPEMFTTGFSMNPDKIAETMDGISVTWMQKMAIENKFAICGSLVISEKPFDCAQSNIKYYNRLVFVHPNGKIVTYDKKHPFTLAGEDKVYSSGSEKLIIDYKGWKICPLICYDLRFPVWARNTENYDLLIFVANWPLKRIRAWETLLKARAIENMSYVIGVNRTGKDINDYEYSGNSLIIDYLGDEIANIEDDSAGIITNTLLKSKQDLARKKLGFLNDKDIFSIL
ncbi:nitrilase family protein [Polaribacter sp. Asnod1-A03]|uniref:nitrilase family protein n=1 Tax=Polaribacter sp. Asnod1-A03 TaxID=3160581 RepID=UPI00386B5DD4